MKHLLPSALCSLFLIFCANRSYAQNCSALNIQLKSDIPSTCSFMVMTMIHDERAGMPYLYVANKEGGLKIYNISDLALPGLVATVPITSFGSLDVMNVIQSGNYLYLSIGNTFTNPQQGGMAIVDVSSPTTPTVTNFYIQPGSANGAGIVAVEGNYAYLGAMKSGLVILDITNKSSIAFVSKFVPDINWPVNNPNPDLYNARGMEVKNSIVYLCYDAGGLRIINCTNKTAPKETGRFANPKLYTPFNLPRAYNNVVIDDTLAYVAVDYCGLEVIRIKDTSNMSLLGWWNPYNCPNNNWFTSPVHANEIHYVKACKYAFLSTGKSDMMVINMADPAHPDSCNFYGGVANNIGTWGVGTYSNQIYLSYICAFIPFSSNYTGVKILTYTPCSTGINDPVEQKYSISPNPAGGVLRLVTRSAAEGTGYRVCDLVGHTLLQGILHDNKIDIDISALANGVYLIKMGNSVSKFIKE